MWKPRLWGSPTRSGWERIAAGESPAAGKDSDNDPGSAAIVAAQAIDKSPEGAVYREAVAAFDARDVQRAVELRRTLEGHPQYGALAEAIDALGLAKSGKLEDALRAAEQLSRIPAMQAESLLIAGEVFQTQGNWSQARWERFTARWSCTPTTCAPSLVGGTLLRFGSHAVGYRHLGKVAALDPTDYRPLRLCGLIRYDYEQFAESADDYRRALERCPPGPVTDEIRLGLAASLRQQQRVDEAFAALESCPETVTVLTERAMCYETAGQVDKAPRPGSPRRGADAPRRPGQPDPGQASAFSPPRGGCRGSAAYRPGGGSHGPQTPLPPRAGPAPGRRNRRGASGTGTVAPLRDMFLRLADLHLKANGNPYDVGVRVQLGELAEKLGRLQSARTWYRAALGLDPENRQAAEAIARLESDAKP